MNEISEKPHDRGCPVCGRSAADASTFLEENINQDKITAASYASRKEPEFMNYRLVRCAGCATIFAHNPPKADAIINAYHQADYDSAVEARQAAATYAAAIQPHLAGLGRKAALEVGTGPGNFLNHLQAAGFERVIGIEPSRAAIEAADDQVRPLIREGIFRDGDFEPGSLDLICCFMTLEHVPDPQELMQAFSRALAPGGKVAVVVHNYQAWLNRLLGASSPIIDIEHLQIYCPQSIETLLTSAGLASPVIRPLTNAYRLAYWLRLLPLPPVAKNALISGLSALRLSEIVVPMNVGNLFCVATKPE